MPSVTVTTKPVYGLGGPATPPHKVTVVQYATAFPHFGGTLTLGAVPAVGSLLLAGSTGIQNTAATISGGGATWTQLVNATSVETGQIWLGRVGAVPSAAVAFVQNDYATNWLIELRGPSWHTSIKSLAASTNPIGLTNIPYAPTVQFLVFGTRYQSAVSVPSGWVQVLNQRDYFAGFTYNTTIVAYRLVSVPSVSFALGTEGHIIASLGLY